MVAEDGLVVRARGLRKDYGKGAGLVRAVDGVDLEVAAGETVAVVGPSGCGKSTLLHLLGGLERASAGELWLAGQRVDQLGEAALARLRRHVLGFVFQGFHLVEELTAVENVELPALLAGAGPRAARREATGLLGQRARRAAAFGTGPRLRRNSPPSQQRPHRRPTPPRPRRRDSRHPGRPCPVPARRPVRLGSVAAPVVPARRDTRHADRGGCADHRSARMSARCPVADILRTD